MTEAIVGAMKIKDNKLHYNNTNADHTMTIHCLLVAPSLTRHPGSGQLTVKRGSTVSLKCQASGFPVPQVRQ